ncbi:excalibur calcium-binding domain-containing protein [Nocardia wallacei]|uniref:excalibur calcium-binding domain-containing protein n=1 Tax=Nocardia wallacei TaxID=480035 RepID=UPI0024580D2A|nr:excalibur calcium-binding domain-containing protein [Nocardia wallacei]
MSVDEPLRAEAIRHGPRHRRGARHLFTIVAATGLLGLCAAPALAAPRDGAVPPGSSGAAPSAGGSGWSDSPHETVLLPPSGDAQPGYPFYATCTQVWAEHGGPLYAGQRGYRAGLDTDGNGVACDLPQ